MDTMTKITYTCWHGEYSVAIPHNEPCLDVVMEEIVEPLLRAAGFHQKTIDKYFNREVY